MGIKTIHIKNYVQILNGNAVNTSDVPKLKALVKELYDHTLKDDPKFHFFFEPEIIFRITTEDCLTTAKGFLQSKNIEFEGYDYPFAPEGKFGEERGRYSSEQPRAFSTNITWSFSCCNNYERR